MSKVGTKPLSIPAGVQVTVSETGVSVKGPKGELNIPLTDKGITIKQENDVLTVIRDSDEIRLKAIHGMYRSTIANAVHGVEKGWEKRLEVVGTGFNVKPQGQDVVFKIGYSHPVVFKAVPGIQFKVEGANKVVVSGVDKHLVGQVSHQMKLVRQPDAYKGKGVRYEGEIIKTKPGKKAKA